jgi:hypothetical protein
MPELIRWFRYLAARLRHVRIVNGDWARVCTSGAAKTLPVRQGNGSAGIFLDPPYDLGERANGLYAHDTAGLAVAVRQWCIENGNDPQYRIVLAGYDSEHEVELAAAGWRSYEWFAAGFLRGGMAQVGGAHQQARERVWASPHCLVPDADEEPQHTQMGIFTLTEDW